MYNDFKIAITNIFKKKNSDVQRPNLMKTATQLNKIVKILQDLKYIFNHFSFLSSSSWKYL